MIVDSKPREDGVDITLAFDVYGTLIDAHGIVAYIREMVGDRAVTLSRVWRDKQLEYSFRRGLMRKYANFAVCTSNALDFACSACKTPLSEEQKRKLLGMYRMLPAFEDAHKGLARLHAAGFRMYAFSNGRADAVEALLANAGLKDFFLGIVSVRDLKTFKPNPDVYRYFLQKSGTSGSNAWLVSSNPFDVIGAISTGMKAAWVQRSPDELFDPWGIKPTITIKNLAELDEQISAQPAS